MPRWDDERGANLVEYALLVLLIALAALVAVQAMGAQHSELWSEIQSDLSGAGS